MFFWGSHFAWRHSLRYGIAPADGGGLPSAEPPQMGIGDRAEAQSPTIGMVGELSNLVTSVRATISSFLDLISLEARRAGIALMWMVMFGFFAAICVGVAWLGLMAVIALCAVSLGLTPIAAVSAIALTNLIVGAALIYGGIGISRDLLFSATRRQLAGKAPVPPHSP